MSDELLPYYRRELSFIRKMGAEFAAANPAIAARLGVSDEKEAKDPHVERKIEAFAYLTARVRHKLDDEFPELVTALLEMLYPQYQAPVPSLAIVQFELDRSQPDLAKGYTVRVEAPLEADTPRPDQITCRFRTCYPVTLFPMEVTEASLGALPFSSAPRAAGAVAALRVELKSFSPTTGIGKFQWPAKITPVARDGRAAAAAGSERPWGLRFFLHGESQHVLPLYELLVNNLVDVTVSSGPTDANPLRLGPGAVRPVGFSLDEGLLPYSPRVLPGYRLLLEYFAFPEKFLFIDVVGLTPETMGRFGTRADLTFYVNRSSPDLEQNVTRDTMRLGCTPVVNLFEKPAEDIVMAEARPEYRVVADNRRNAAYEIYSVDRVAVSDDTGAEVEYQPFYSFKHAQTAGPGAFWYATRRPATVLDGGANHGTEVFLTPIDLEFTPSPAPGRTLHVETTCLNRDQPARLPFGGGEPKLALPEGGPVRREMLTKPTDTLRIPGGTGAMWRVVSHLSLNHLSITGHGQGAEGLREILRLYDFTGSADTKRRINSILDVTTKRVVGRAGGVISGGLCRGIETTLTFDETGFPDQGVFLMASVLDRFLALHCSMNSFSQLVVRTRQRDKDLRRWAPRVGERVLL
jgi:type VI secretion system protein ImpG